MLYLDDSASLASHHEHWKVIVPVLKFDYALILAMDTLKYDYLSYYDNFIKNTGCYLYIPVVIQLIYV